MEDKTVKTQVKNVAVSPQKLRLVADVIRGMKVDKAIDTLRFMNKKGALSLRKAVSTASANAKDLYSVETGVLTISKVTIDEGVKQRKPRFGSRGRVSMLTRRKSIINLEVKVTNGK
ncbi:MAG: 50S ribosomal protein L22 [candidate division WS6 bacterium GW2011_GWF2_39_15]|uniref:50S ribosomal protein L22 n=1 Tax=candidate division WS6 bacterium GW2011_GWF2_39_15 TaxID=1619100 RepID=A0A0G0MYP6_9BACT|nr:MAG: 50S ribosomal protein L22 [candidate division WS6 bacterium GW2011_GWF2_39_15]